ncbi:MAG: carbohydrate kinase family protein, partial [Kiritimatiellae bacterium]|nr:carbohydrate kinase family protein [Kiritimatiellia bacterium]
LVPPALRYTDICVINEIEAGQVTDTVLRAPDGSLRAENMEKALAGLKALGVSTWAVIHCPELGCGIDTEGRFVEVPSLRLPDGYIKGTVGAGDAFCAGVLYGVEREWTLADALRLGACTAAASLSEVGASEGVQSVDEVLALAGRYPG